MISNVKRKVLRFSMTYSFILVFSINTVYMHLISNIWEIINDIFSLEILRKESSLISVEQKRHSIQYLGSDLLQFVFFDLRLLLIS